MTENRNDAGEWERCRERLGALSEAVLARETLTSPMIGSDTWTGNGGYDTKLAESGNGGRDGNLMESGKGGMGGNLVESGKSRRDGTPAESGKGGRDGNLVEVVGR